MRKCHGAAALLLVCVCLSLSGCADQSSVSPASESVLTLPGFNDMTDAPVSDVSSDTDASLVPEDTPAPTADLSTATESEGPSSVSSQEDPTEEISSAEPDASSETPETSSGQGPERTFSPEHGSAVTPEGNVVIVSIFASDATTSWNDDSYNERLLIAESLNKLGIATDWLSEQVQRYEKRVSFVYNWEENEDLFYQADFTEDLLNDVMHRVQTNWLEDHIDAAALLEKYQADSILFAFFFNTDYKNEVRPWTMSHQPGDSVSWEYINFYLKFEGVDMPASGFAHEILHTFGAPDLYIGNYYIGRNFADHLAEIGSNDIMFTTTMTSIIVDRFSDLDAYYVGIGPRPQEADEWDLERSEYDR